MSRSRGKLIPTVARALLCLSLGGAFSGALGGCAADPSEGYSTATPFSEDIRTVAVPIFENSSFIRGVEFELTDALIKEIEAQTPYKVTSQAHADTIIEGKILSVELDQLSKSRFTGLGEEVIVALTIDFQWRDMRSDKPLVERKSFSGHGLFVPSTPTAERVELGRIAAVQQLARDVVAQLMAQW